MQLEIINLASSKSHKICRSFRYGLSKYSNFYSSNFFITNSYVKIYLSIFLIHNWS